MVIHIGTDILFSVFDSLKGPVILYTSLDAATTARTIAIKSFIAIGAMEKSMDFKPRHAAIPLPSLDKIVFYYLFGVKEAGSSNMSFATIAYSSDSDTSTNFYRFVPELHKHVELIVAKIQANFIFDRANPTISQELMQTISKLKNISPEISSSEVSPLKFEDFKDADIPFLLDYFPEDLDKVLYALLLEKPILLIGEIKDLIKKVVATLEYLVPHRMISNEFLTTYVDPKDKDILICPPRVSFVKKYKGITKMDIVHRKVESKEKSATSLQNMLQTIKIAPKEKQEQFIRIYIDKLLAKTTELMELCERTDMSREEIRKFRENLPGDELNIIISMVKKFAPQFEGPLFHFARSLF
ncbi:MAG: hypothetical protein ACXACB_09480 [Promethearchaeota archaeon]